MAHVLVVEDDASNAQVFEGILRRIGGHEVAVTERVEEILKQCRSGAIDLVIMDVSLSRSYYRDEKVDGLDIARLLKKDPSTRKIPILLVTAHARKGDRERFLASSGAQAYVTKPVFDHHAFLDCVHGLIADSKVPAEE